MIITLEQAQTRLRDYYEIDDLEKADLQQMISAAIGWVEKYTDYALNEKPVTVYTRDCGTVRVVTYPFEVITQDVRSKRGALSSVLSYKPNTAIELIVGNWGTEEVSSPLIEACYKLIVYYYENRDMYKQDAPTDVQMLINQWRRSATV